MDISCPGNLVPIFRLVLFCQLSPSLETFTVARQKHDVQSGSSAPSSSSCADAARSSSSRIVALGIDVVAFAAAVISFCSLGTAAPAYSSKTALQSQQPLSECRNVARSVLSALDQLCLPFSVLPGQSFHGRRELQLHLSDRPLPPVPSSFGPEVSRTKCEVKRCTSFSLQTESAPPP